jgi:hypothetical protein
MMQMLRIERGALWNEFAVSTCQILDLAGRACDFLACVAFTGLHKLRQESCGFTDGAVARGGKYEGRPHGSQLTSNVSVTGGKLFDPRMSFIPEVEL